VSAFAGTALTVTGTGFDLETTVGYAGAGAGPVLAGVA
jgi:hypothetical protein